MLGSLARSDAEGAYHHGSRADFVEGQPLVAGGATGHRFTVLGARLGRAGDGTSWWITNLYEGGFAAAVAAGSGSPTHPALHDELTGLPNRILFLDRLEHVLRAAQRDDSASALCLLQLAHLADVKAAAGEASSRRMLQAAASTIAGTLRNVDTVSRFAEERFAVLLPATSEIGAVSAIMRMREVLQEPLEIDGHATDLSVRAGVALSPVHASDASSLIAFAAAALRAAVRDGNWCQLYDAGLEVHAQV